MQNILIIAESQSYLIVSLKEKLEEAAFNVIIERADVTAINKIKDPVNGIIIYADEDLIAKQQCLNYIKDKAVEDDVPVFVAGTTNEIDDIKVIIPKFVIRKEFLRPINIGEMSADVIEYVEKFGKHNKKKILVVDDSGAMLRNVKGWLENKYQVILANSGAMAIKYLALNRPDLILLDYEMPVCDGKQVLEMIRTEMEFTDIPVIFLTSKGDKESVMKVMALKPEGYLLKTMEPAQIIAAVDDFFEKRKGLLNGN